MGQFASDTGQLSRIVTLNDIGLTAAKDGSLSMDVTAKTFRYLGPMRKWRPEQGDKGRQGGQEMKTLAVIALGLLLVACTGEEFGDLKAELKDKTKDSAREDRPAAGGEAIRAGPLQGFRSTRSFQQPRKSSWFTNRQAAAAADSNPI